MRKYSFLDQAILQINQGLRTLIGTPIGTQRANPASPIDQKPMSRKDKKLSVRLMRVNHTGEVCAQALYQGQALTAHSIAIKQAMKQAALEENDHLVWCQHRIQQLDGHTSYLNPLWWVGSFALGAFAGLIGDRWSLGFLAETEHQVCRHLQSHLAQLPTSDASSRAILAQMHWDEQHHADHAMEQGGAILPFPIPTFMTFSAKLMTTASYYV